MSIISSRLTPSGFFAAVAAAAAAAPAAVELPLAALSFRSPPGAAVPAAAAADPLPSAPLAPPPEVALVIPRMSRTVAILVGSALLCSALSLSPSITAFAVVGSAPSSPIRGTRRSRRSQARSSRAGRSVRATYLVVVVVVVVVLSSMRQSGCRDLAMRRTGGARARHRGCKSRQDEDGCAINQSISQSINQSNPILCSAHPIVLHRFV